MRIKKWIGAVAFLVCATIITYIVYLKTLEGAANNVIFQFAMELTEGDQIRQILLTMGIYIYGYIIATALHVKENVYYNCLLAYPVGIVCWCLMSFVVVIVGIPYTVGSMTIGMLLLLIGAICYIKRTEIAFKGQELFRTCLYMLGVAMISSSGILPVYTTVDSSYFIMKYGEILSIDGGFTDNASFWLTWTGVALAFLSSLVHFCGVYSIYTIHHTLIIVFLLFFGMNIYQTLEAKMGTKKAWLAAVSVTAFMVITPAFYMVAHWIISNSYFMVYMYLYLWIVKRIHEEEINVTGANILLASISMFIALMRAESALTVCFLIICASTLKIGKRTLLYAMLLPAGIGQSLYWIRTYFSIGTIFSKNMSKIAFAVIVLGYIGTLVYIVLIRERVPKKLTERMFLVILAGLALLNVVLMIIRPDRAVRNIDSFAYNITNAYWGFFPWLVILAYAIFINYKQKINFWDFVWLSYVLFNFGLCMGSGGGLRHGEGDSYNRLVSATIPFVYYAMINHIKLFFTEKRIKDNEINNSDTML